MVHILFNEFAGAHYGQDNLEAKMKEQFPGEELSFKDIVTVEDKQAYIDALSPKDKLVIVGGDGTLNVFVNAIEDKEYPFTIYCFAAGTGNDFINDVTGIKSDCMVEINDYIRNLPIVEVNGKTYKFINGIGYGIDGYCCEKGDAYKAKTGKSPNYTKYAILGMLGGFGPRKAKVTVDGVTKEYKSVWLAPAMNGRYFGGGMMIAPAQDRLNEKRELTVVTTTKRNRIGMLMVFKKIFTGTHTKHTKIFHFETGKCITVEFNKPTALQVDGETILGVTKYTAKSSAYKE